MELDDNYDPYAEALNDRARITRQAQKMILNWLNFPLSLGDKMIVNQYVTGAIEGLRGLDLSSKQVYEPAQEAAARYICLVLGVKDVEAVKSLVHGYPSRRLSKEAYDNMERYLSP